MLIKSSLPLRASDPHDCVEAVRFPRQGADGGGVCECPASEVHQLAETAGFIASKGIPEPLASVLLVAAIVVLIVGSILLVFGSNTVLGASLLLLFLVPTTLIFHTFPVDSGFAMNLALIGALILAITRAWGNGVPSFTHLRSKG